MVVLWVLLVVCCVVSDAWRVMLVVCCLVGSGCVMFPRRCLFVVWCLLHVMWCSMFASSCIVWGLLVVVHCVVCVG